MLEKLKEKLGISDIKLEKFDCGHKGKLYATLHSGKTMCRDCYQKRLHG